MTCAKWPGMNVGLYQGVAAMQALEQWQAAVSQNLASATVPGYKRIDVDFHAALDARSRQNLSGPAAQQSARSMPQAALRRDFSQGELRATNEPDNLAIQGEGYFQVQGPDGKTAYTRDGEFHRNADGTLVTKTGLPVLGQSGEPMQFDPKKGPVSFGADGRVVQGIAEVGRLGVFSFDQTHAQSLDGGLFRPGEGQTASAVETPAVESGFLEGSNVSPLHSMVELITVQRAYEANQKAINTQDQRLSSAIQILGNPQA